MVYFLKDDQDNIIKIISFIVPIMSNFIIGDSSSQLSYDKLIFSPLGITYEAFPFDDQEYVSTR